MLGADIITDTLERVVELEGDPQDKVYSQLFRTHPEFRDLFVMDKDGGVRANMLTTSINCMIGVAERNHTARFLLEAACMHHDGYGLRSKDIDVFFQTMRDVFRDILGEDWTHEMEIAWCKLLEDLTLVGQQIENA